MLRLSKEEFKGFYKSYRGLEENFSMTILPCHGGHERIIILSKQTSELGY